MHAPPIAHEHGRAIASALAVAVLVGGLASFQGGYFATSWGWATLGCLVVLGAWLLRGAHTEAGRLDLAYGGALALLAAWIGLSIAWSDVPWRSVLELERTLVSVAGVAVLLALARRRDLLLLVAAVLAAATLVAGYGLATRLFPEQLGTYDPLNVYRLAEPVGYWNGLGVLCALGLLLAVGLVAEARADAVRATSSATVVVLATTLYFTYSRASWIALAAGLAVALLVSPRRLRLLAACALTAVPAALAVASASSSYALTHHSDDLTAAAADGRRLALLLVALMLLAAGLTLVSVSIERRIELPRRAHRAVDAAVALAAVAVCVGALVGLGGPVAAAERAWSAFEREPTADAVDLDDRLFSLSGNGRVELWRAAWDMYVERPVLGAGAGTFEREWQSRGDSGQRVRDAHGLYVETLGELGTVGLALLVAVLAVPFVAAARARRSPLVAALAAAFAAYLVHAGADWDWELAAVTLLALVVGGLLVVAARPDRPARALPRPARTSGLVVVAVVALFALVGLLGNRALDDAQRALERRDADAAIAASDRARSLMPWSPAPWNARGTAALVDGKLGEAERSFRNAIDLDDGDWRSWLNLAIATTGRERARALARARILYPRSTEIARVAAELGAGP